MCPQVVKDDVDEALRLLNFAIYHKELTDMEEREQREREVEMKNRADSNVVNEQDARSAIDFEVKHSSLRKIIEVAIFSIGPAWRMLWRWTRQLNQRKSPPTGFFH